MPRTVIPTMLLAAALLGSTAAWAQGAGQCFLGATTSRYGDGGRVQGDIGTVEPGGLLQMGRRFVVEAGGVASAQTVRVGPGSQIAAVRANELEANRASVGRWDPVLLPLLTGFCPVPDLGCGSETVTVRKNRSLALEPGSYGAVELQNGAELVLGPGVYELCSLRGGRRARITEHGDHDHDRAVDDDVEHDDVAATDDDAAAGAHLRGEQLPRRDRDPGLRAAHRRGRVRDVPRAGLPGRRLDSRIGHRLHCARFTNLVGTTYRFLPSDLDSNADGRDDRGRTLVTANTAEPIPNAAIERVRFDCPSGSVVQPSQLACRPTGLSDSSGQLFPPEVAALVSCALTFEVP